MVSLRDEESFDLDAATESVTVEQVRQPASESTKRTRKVQVPLTVDGRIDLDLLNSSQRNKIEKALQLEVESRIATVQSEVKPIIQFNQEYVPTVIDAFMMVVRGLANLSYRFKLQEKMKPDFIQFLRYSTEQKDKLKEPTAKLIEKYVPPKYLCNQELANFILAFGTVTQEMLTSAGVNYLLSKGLTAEQIEGIKNGTIKLEQTPQSVNGVEQVPVCQ